MEFCSSNDQCVIDPQGTMTLCQETNFCEEKIIPVLPTNDWNICEIAGGSSVITAVYPQMPAGCTHLNTTNCYVSTHTTCNGVDCKALCEASSGDPPTYCIEVCESFSCSTFQTYNGPLCTFSPGCEPTMDNPAYISQASISGVSTCEPFCIPENSKCTAYGCPFICEGDYFKANFQCMNNNFCTDISDPTCIPSTNYAGDPFYVTLPNNEEVYCFDEPSQTFGDYWCPKGFVYNSLSEYCQPETEVCDSGFSGNLEHGCDVFTTPMNDSLWLQYQSQCVDQFTLTAIGLQTYDRMCCYDSMFNDFNIYQWGEELTHIRIY